MAYLFLVPAVAWGGFALWEFLNKRKRITNLSIKDRLYCSMFDDKRDRTWFTYD